MNILFASSEAVPFCKTGGLADVVGALTSALSAKRHSVLLVLPFYRQIRSQLKKAKPFQKVLHISMGNRMETVHIWELPSRTKIKTIFIEAPAFDRDGLYGDAPGTAYHDNDFRYALFSRAVLEAAKAVGFKPNIIHCHDWQTGLVPAYLHFFYRKDSFFSSTSSVFTIHNMAYQGNFSQTSFGMTGLPWSAYHPKEIEFYGQVSYLKSGLVYSDVLNTVSPTYAKEISSDPQFGCGMQGVLQERRSRFRGILNGLDVKIWDPLKDPFIAERYDKTSLNKKTICKSDLQTYVKLPAQVNVPILGFIGRLDYQKGIDILVETAPLLLKEGVQMVFLGQGNPHYLSMLEDLMRRYPSQVFIETAFAEPLAHKIYSGADIFLMPSRFEPCGLSQMIAMRYGTLPVVTPTGGLLDTVVNYPSEKSNGFVSRQSTSGDFLNAVSEALKQYKRSGHWQSIQKRAMSKDYSWKNSVNGYLSLYASASEWRS